MEALLAENAAVFGRVEGGETWESIDAHVLKWEAFLNGIATSLDDDGRRAVLAASRTFASVIVNCINSDRSKLSASACSYVRALAVALGQTFDAEPYMAPMVAICGRANKLFGKRSEETLEAIIRAGRGSTLVGVVCSTMTSKNKQMRESAATLLVSLLAFQPSLSTDQLEAVHVAVPYMLGDSSPQVRDAGRNAFGHLAAKWRDRAVALYQSLDPRLQKAVGTYLGDTKATAAPAPRKPIVQLIRAASSVNGNAPQGDVIILDRSASAAAAAAAASSSSSVPAPFRRAASMPVPFANGGAVPLDSFAEPATGAATPVPSALQTFANDLIIQPPLRSNDDVSMYGSAYAPPLSPVVDFDAVTESAPVAARPRNASATSAMTSSTNAANAVNAAAAGRTRSGSANGTSALMTSSSLSTSASTPTTASTSLSTKSAPLSRLEVLIAATGTADGDAAKAAAWDAVRAAIADERSPVPDLAAANANSADTSTWPSSVRRLLGALQEGLDDKGVAAVAALILCLAELVRRYSAVVMPSMHLFLPKTLQSGLALNNRVVADAGNVLISALLEAHWPVQLLSSATRAFILPEFQSNLRLQSMLATFTADVIRYHSQTCPADLSQCTRISEMAREALTEAPVLDVRLGQAHCLKLLEAPKADQATLRAAIEAFAEYRAP